MDPRPIIIVTGANGGVGYGICERLLLNFCGSEPLDALPQPFATPGSKVACEFTPTTHLTLIIACRNPSRASSAKANLLLFLDKHIEQHIQKHKKKGDPPTEHVERMKEFRKNLEIDLLPLDLASIASTFEFCSLVYEKYPYISHAIFNAGWAPWAGLDWYLAIKSLIINIVDAVSFPRYKLQTAGVISDDNLGLTFQSNIFGHFIIARYLQNLMKKSPTTARVIWTTSHDTESAINEIDWEDWQMTKSPRPYEMTKYEMQLIVHALDQDQDQGRISTRKSSSQSPIRHFLSEPGVTATNIFAAHLSFIDNISMVLAFMIARLISSPFHPITWINGAIAAVHLALVPLQLLAERAEPAVYGSRASRFGKPYVQRYDTFQWESNQTRAKDLMKKCDDLLRSLEIEHQPRVTKLIAKSKGT